MTYEKSLSEFVRETREKAGFSVQGLAKRSGLTIEQIEDIEAGKDLFLPATVRQKLAKGLKLNPVDIKQYERILIVSYDKVDDKYINANSKTKGMGSMGRKIPAEVTKEQKEHIENYTKQIYKTMDCGGVVRVDYLMDESREHVYVNEINTVPGSFSFYLWEHNDLPFGKLLDVLIEEALNQAQLRKDKVLKYDSKILDNLTRNGKQGGCKR